MPGHSQLAIAVSLLSLSLCACGGGGGGEHVAQIPPPPPTPTTPAGYEPVAIFPAITSSTTFAAVGAEISGNSAAPVTTTGFSVKYDQPSGLYLFDLPSGESGGFYSHASDESSDYWIGGLINSSDPGTVWPPMTILKPAATNPDIQLSYTTVAAYMQAGPMQDLPHGFVAFGIPTPEGAVPVSGSASYTTIVQGASIDDNYVVGGDATMQFNFANGTLAGHFDPDVYQFYGDGTAYPLGRYDFVNTVYSSGATSFSGQLSNAAAPGLGSFSGQFTGPNAQELMSNWIVPFSDPINGQSSTIFGVWVGKKN